MKPTYTMKWFKENAHAFDQWYDPETFCGYSWGYLIECCPQHFMKWWDPKRFRWNDHGMLLPEYCIDYIDIWYKEDYYDLSYDELVWEALKTKMESHLERETGGDW